MSSAGLLGRRWDIGPGAGPGSLEATSHLLGGSVASVTLLNPHAHRQKHRFWCWAAVSACLDSYRRGTHRDQCDVVQAIRAGCDFPCPCGMDDQGDCYGTEVLGGVLLTMGLIRSAAQDVRQFDDDGEAGDRIHEALGEARPVAAALNVDVGMYHFVVIHQSVRSAGHAGVGQRVSYWDPRADPVTLSIESLNRPGASHVRPYYYFACAPEPAIG